MKRLLAAGFGDCYQVCPVFRDGESGRLHNPEFTMIEWYRLDYGVAEMQHDVDRVLRVACAEVRAISRRRDASPTGRRCARRPPASIAAAPRPRRSAPRSRRAASSRPSAADWDRDAWLDLLMGAVVGPALGHDAPVFVDDYPASQAALARLRAEADGTMVADRFELYVDGLELANGFHELGDAAEQRRRFERDLAARGARTGRPRIRSTRTCSQRSRTACRIARASRWVSIGWSWRPGACRPWMRQWRSRLRGPEEVLMQDVTG